MNTAEGVSVWVLLYVGDQPSKSSIEIEPIPKNVGALVKALKEELQPDLSHCSAANIEVYQAGTLVMTRTPRTLIDPGNTVPGDTTSKEPLIAFAPAKKEESFVNISELQATDAVLSALRRQALTDQISVVMFVRNRDWQPILNNLPEVELATNSVVNGWRCENGSTTTPRLFLRPHLLDLKAQIDTFMISKAVQRLFVSGAPGAGKTSFFFVYALHWVQKHPDKKCLIIQYRELSRCEFFVVESNCIKRYPEHVPHPLVTQALKSFTASESFSFFMVDGVRQNIVLCSDIIAFLTGELPEAKGIYTSSLQFRIRTGDGTFKSDQFMDVYSWSLEDYMLACNARFMATEELLDMLKPYSSTHCHVVSDGVENGAGAGEDTGDTGQSATKESYLIELLERKFYYAGGSARFMFEDTTEGLVKNCFPKLIAATSPELWRQFASSEISMGSNYTMNTLMQVLPAGEGYEQSPFPVSRYVMLKAYEKCGQELVKAVRAASDATKNPVLRGFAFELEQIDLLERSRKVKKAVANETSTIVLPTSGEKAIYDGYHLSNLPQGSSFLIECLKWNQGCYDSALYHDQTLVTIQFTLQKTHTLKVSYIRCLIRALEAAKKNVRDVSHVAIVEDRQIAEVFTFEEPEGVGFEDSSNIEFEVDLLWSSKLSMEEAGSLKLGAETHKLRKISVYGPRRSKRRLQS